MYVPQCYERLLNAPQANEEINLFPVYELTFRSRFIPDDRGKVTG